MSSPEEEEEEEEEEGRKNRKRYVNSSGDNDQLAGKQVDSQGYSWYRHACPHPARS